MCGIFGFSKRTKVTQSMVPILAAAMELRGDDSWGVTDGYHLYKHTGSILANYEDHGCETPTYHTRGASVGTVSERNAHPFEYISTDKGVVVVGVHNGHITNNDELKRQYHEQRKEFEVDSEHIFAQLAEGLPTKDIYGYGAVVWYEYPIGEPKKRRRYISTFNNTSMNIVRLSTGEIAFASTIESIRIAARFAGVDITGIVKVVNKMKYEILANGSVKSHGLMEWDEKPPIVYSPHDHASGYMNRNLARGGSSSYQGNFQSPYSTCKSWACNRPTSEDEVICEDCVKKLIMEYIDLDTTETSEFKIVDAVLARRNAAAVEGISVTGGTRVDLSATATPNQRVWPL